MVHDWNPFKPVSYEGVTNLPQVSVEECVSMMLEGIQSKVDHEECHPELGRVLTTPFAGKLPRSRIQSTPKKKSINGNPGVSKTSWKMALSSPTWAILSLVPTFMG